MIGQSNNAISLPTVSLYLSADVCDGSLSLDELSILISFCFGEAVFLLLVFMVRFDYRGICNVISDCKWHSFHSYGLEINVCSNLIYFNINIIIIDL